MYCSFPEEYEDVMVKVTVLPSGQNILKYELNLL